MPASNPRALEKARGLPADALIFDLEDAVAPTAKAEARRLAVEAALEGGYGHRELIIRVNPLDSPWGAEDVKAAAQSGVDAVLLPKIESADQLRQAYPQIDAFFRAKDYYDPDHLFTNTFYNKYAPLLSP